MNRSDYESMVWFHLMSTAHKIGRVGADLVQSYGITPPQYLVLRQIRDENLTQQALADRLSVTKGNISQMLAILERDDLVIRQQEGAANRLYLTEEGKDVLDRVEPAHRELVRHCLGLLSIDDLAHFDSLLNTVDQGVDMRQSG